MKKQSQDSKSADWVLSQTKNKVWTLTITKKSGLPAVL